MKNEKEFKWLCGMYPLFQLSIDTLDNGEENLVVKHGSSTSRYQLVNGRLINGHRDIEYDHLLASIANTFSELYPELYFSCNSDRNHLSLCVWVKQNDGRDGTFIGDIDITAPELHSTLTAWQHEVKKSKLDGYFFCSAHKIAEPKENYGYWYYSGAFCKQYGEENPKHKNMAARETYN